MIEKQTYSLNFSSKWIAKVPTYAWWLIFYVFAIGANYFVDDTTINQMPLMFQTIYKGAEMSNLFYMHLLTGLFSVVIFEIIAFLYSMFVVSYGRRCGGFSFNRKDFVAVFRFFYLFVLVVSGLLQIFYYYNTLTIVFGRLFFTMIPRLAVMFCILMYFKSNFLNKDNYHTFIAAMFIPYFVYELFTILSFFVY